MKIKLKLKSNTRVPCENGLPEQYIHEISHLLKIESPPIQYVDLLFDCNGQMMGMHKLIVEDIPKGVGCCAAFYDDTENKILISRKLPLVDENGEVSFRNTTPAERTYYVCHELRHVWQDKYNRELYYKEKRASLFEVINDLSEIDADAFALAYCFSCKDSLSIEDMSEHFLEISFQATADGGKRWERAREITKEYGWTPEKISYIESRVEYEKIDSLINILKENGLYGKC